MLRFPSKYSLALASTTVTLEGAFLIFQDSMLMINFKTLLEPGCSTHGAFALLLFLYKLATAFAIVLCWASCTLRKGFLLLCGQICNDPFFFRMTSRPRTTSFVEAQKSTNPNFGGMKISR